MPVRSLPLVVRHSLTRGLEIGVRLPWAATGSETTGSPTFPGDPCTSMLRSSTPVGPSRTCLGRALDSPVGRVFRTSDNVDFHGDQDDGAQSRSLLARCLRFAARVTPMPRKTRFRPVASLPDGIGYPPGSPQQGFCFVSLHHFPLVRASWRNRSPCQSLIPSIVAREPRERRPSTRTPHSGEIPTSARGDRAPTHDNVLECIDRRWAGRPNPGRGRARRHGHSWSKTGSLTGKGMN